MKYRNKDLPVKGKVRNDVILIAVVLLVSAAAMLFLFLGGKDGGYAVVTYDGMEIARYSLSSDVEEIILTGEEKEWSNTVVISGGKVSVSEANCPDGICSSHRSISKTGETIICLPHKLVITIVGAEDTGLDGAA